MPLKALISDFVKRERSLRIYTPLFLSASLAGLAKYFGNTWLISFNRTSFQDNHYQPSIVCY